MLFSICSICALLLQCKRIVWSALSLLSSGFVRRTESFPVQWQPSGPEGLPTQCPKLFCGGHVPVCTSHSYPPLCAEVLGKDTQPLATLHFNAWAAGLWKGSQPAQQTQTEHRVLWAGEHHTTTTGVVLTSSTLFYCYFYPFSPIVLYLSVYFCVSPTSFGGLKTSYFSPNPYRRFWIPWQSFTLCSKKKICGLACGRNGASFPRLPQPLPMSSTASLNR